MHACRSTLEDPTRARSIVLAGAFFYPFIALSYFFAGLWGAVGFIVLARAMNGISYAFDSVGRSTYIRRMSEKGHAGSSFGFMRSITNFGWIVAVLVSAVLIDYFEIYQLFLFIVPASVLSILILLRAPKDSVENTDHAWASFLSPRVFAHFFQEILLWNSNLKRLALLMFTLTAASASIEYFMPIELFVDGTDMHSIILFVLIFTLPTVFGGAFGWLADRSPPYLITGSFLALGWLLIILGFASTYSLKLLVVFLIGSLLVFLGVFIDAEMTKRGDPRQYGTLSGGTLEVGEFASLLGPILVGLLIDHFGISTAFSVLGAAVLVLAIALRPVHHELRKARPVS